MNTKRIIERLSSRKRNRTRIREVEKNKQTRLRRRLLELAIAGTLATPVNSFAQGLPTGGNVVGGNASISNSDVALDIAATSMRTVVNWDSFNVGNGNIVRFDLPSANAAILNRVTSPNMPSTIAGTVNSNGNVYLVNPSGVLVGQTGMINTNGFTASTFDVSNAEFLSGGNLSFHDNDSDGSIINYGSINTGAGGSHLIARDVANHGSIISEGNITLAGGGIVELDNEITYTQASRQTLASGISPTAGLLQNTGTIRATGAVSVGGEVYLVNPNGNILHDGTISAQIAGYEGESQGGHVQLQATNIELSENSRIDAQGTTRGGEVLIGGDWQGSGDLHQATRVTLHNGAVIDVSATERGDGGTIVLWSDVSNSDSATEVSGTLLARAGALGGNGGNIETSGHRVDTTNIVVDSGATNGDGGLWLIDPYNYTIDATAADTIVNTLNTGTSVEVTTSASDVSLGGSTDSSDAGDITLSSSLVTGAMSGDAVLTLKAHRSIRIDANSSIDATQNGNTAKLSVVLWADQDGDDSGGVRIDNSEIKTNGGGLWVGGGSGTTTWTPYAGAAEITVGDSFATAPPTWLAGVTDGIELIDTNVDTLGGHVWFAGRGLYSSWNDPTFGILLNNSDIDVGMGSMTLQGSVSPTHNANHAVTAGVHITYGSDLSTTTGDINIAGIVETTALSGRPNGVWIGHPLTGSTMGEDLAITTSSGNIVITGDGLETNGFSGERHGVMISSDMANSEITIGSESGDIFLEGNAAFTSFTTNTSGLGIEVFEAGGRVSIISQTGEITLRGTNTQESSSFYTENAVKLEASNGEFGAIRIGSDGINPYSGDILIQGDSIWQGNYFSTARPISVKTSGNLTIEPVGSSFTKLQFYNNTNPSSLQFDNTWDFGTELSSFTLGKPGNTLDLKFYNGLTTNGPIYLFGGTVDITSTWTTTDSTSGDVNISANALTGSAAINLADGRSLNLTQSGNSTFSGIISGNNAGITKAGDGSVVLIGANTATGTVTVNEGVLQIGTGGTTGDWLGDVVSNATFTIDRSDNLVVNSVSGTGELVINDGSFTADVSGLTGTITVNEGATLGLIGGVTFENTLILNGTLTSASGHNTLALQPIMGENAVFAAELGATLTLDSPSGPALSTNNRTVEFSGAGDITVVDALVLGTGGVEYTGSGVLTLAAANDYSGDTVSGGHGAYIGGLIRAGVSSVGTPGNVTSGPFGTGRLVIWNDHGIDLAGQTINNNAQIYNRGPRIVNSTGSGSFGGEITSSYDFNFESLAGAELTFTGDLNRLNTNIDITKQGAGVLNFDTTDTIETINVDLGTVKLGRDLTETFVNVRDGGTLDVNGFDINVIGRNLRFAGSGVDGQGALVNSSDEPSLLAARHYSEDGGFTIGVQAGDINLQGSIYNNNPVTKIGPGTLSYHSGTTVPELHVNEGTVRFHTTNGFDQSITVAENAVLDLVSYSTRNMTGQITGDGRVTLTGTGTVTLDANHTYTGGTTINGGVLKFGRNDVLPDTGTVTVLGGEIQMGSYHDTIESLSVQGGKISSTTGTLNITADVDLQSGELSVPLSGAIDFVKTGADTLVVTELDWYTGTTTISEGTLILRNDSPATTSSFEGPGALVIEPESSSFDHAFDTTDWTFDSALGALTIGKSGNTSGIVVNEDLSIAGPINMYGGSFTIDTGHAISTTNGDISIIASRFINNSGSAALNVGGSGNTWQVWSSNANPFDGSTPDVRGNLPFDFKQYGASYGNSDAQGTGNGLFFSYTPTLTATVSDQTTELSKVYDGTTNGNATATINSAFGFVDGDSSLGSVGFSATFASKHVGTDIPVTITGEARATSSVATGSKPVYGYQIASSSFESVTGTITPLAVNVTGLTANDKVYDGTTDGTMDVSAAVFDNLIEGDDVTFLSTAAVFDSNQVGVGRTVTFAGTYTGADANNYIFTENTATADITTAPLTITGITANNRVYDGTTNATIDTSGHTLVGLVMGDDVSLDSASGSFVNKNAELGKEVTLSASVSGVDSSNYFITVDSATADITPAALNVSNFSASNRVYDGTTTATVGYGSVAMAGLIAGDMVTMESATGAFTDKNVGNGKTVSITGAYSGADVSNYTISETPVTADITPKPVAVSGITADHKVYDGSTTASVDGSRAVYAGVLVGDDVSLSVTGLFSDKNVGDAKSITLTPSYSGADANNYLFTEGPITANITPKPILVSGITADDKIYDATTAATINAGSATINDLVAGDDVTISTVTGIFGDKNVGHAKVLTLSGAFAGADAGNYNIAFEDATASITPLALSLSGLTADNKVYDATNTATLSGTPMVSPLSGDTVNVESSLSTSTFADTNVANGIAVTVNGYSLSGADAGNYTLQQPSGLTASITPAPLIVRANSDGKFTGESDNAGYAGVHYEGFVGGETDGVLGGSLAINRSDVGDDTLGIHVGVLTPSGLTSSNYDISYVNGDYTIFSLGQLIIRFDNSRSTYGGPENFAFASAEYSNGSVQSLAPPTVSGNVYTFTDGGGTIELTLGLDGGTYGTGGQLEVGSYALIADDLTETSSNVNDTVLIVGTHSVAPLAVTPSASGVSKVYDGTTSMTSLSVGLSGTVSGDSVNVAGVGEFASSNAGTGLSYNVNQLSLSGADAGNYFLSGGNSLSGTDGVITPRPITLTAPTSSKTYDGTTDYVANEAQLNTLSAQLGVIGDTVQSIVLTFDDKNVGANKTLTASAANIMDGNGGANYNVSYAADSSSSVTRLDSVQWVGGATGDWSDPSNWAGGAIPDHANVVNVRVADGVSPTFDIAVAGTVQIDSYTGGNLLVDSGTLAVGTLDVQTLTQNGGDIQSNTQLFIDDLTQNGGSISGPGGLTIYNRFNQSTSGVISLTGDATIQHATSNLGINHLSANNIDLSNATGAIELNQVTASGTLTVNNSSGDIFQTSGGGITVNSGAVISTAGNVRLDETTNDFQGAVQLNGNSVTIVDSAGGLELGEATVTGTFSATTINGSLNQSDGGGLTIDGQTMLDSDGDITLISTTNDFQGTLTIRGENVSIMDASGDLTIGNVTAGSALDLSTTDGSIVQSLGSTVSVVDQTGFTSNADIMFAGSSNDFQGVVNLTGRDATVADSVDGFALGTVHLSGDLNLMINGELTQSSSHPMTVGGVTTLESQGNITLSGTNINLQGAVNLTGQDIAITDSHGGIELGTVQANGDLSLNAGSGAITQLISSHVEVVGRTILNATADITLEGTGNDFQGTVDVSAQNISVTDASGGIQLGDVLASGSLSVTTVGGPITQSSIGHISTVGATRLDSDSDIVLNGDNNDLQSRVDASGQNVSLSNSTGGLQLGSITAIGTLTLNSTGGSITQTSGGDLLVSDVATLNSSLDIIMDESNNDFQSTVHVTGRNITLRDSHGGIEFGNVLATGDFTVVALGGSITQIESDSIFVAAVTDLTADQDIVLGGPNNDFQGPVNLEGRNAKISDSQGGITLGTVVATNDLSIASTGGDVTQTNTSRISVGRETTLVSSGNVNLTGANNDFGTSLTIDASAFQINDLNDTSDEDYGSVLTESISHTSMEPPSLDPTFLSDQAQSIDIHDSSGLFELDGLLDFDLDIQVEIGDNDTIMIKSEASNNLDEENDSEERDAI